MRAGYPAVYLVSAEYQRMFGEIEKAASHKDVSREYFSWVLGEGLYKKGSAKILAETEGPNDVLKAIRGTVPKGSVIVLPLFHHFLEEPTIQTALVNMMGVCKENEKTIIIVAPTIKLPIEVEKEFALIESALPTENDLHEVLNGIIEGAQLKKAGKMPGKELSDSLVSAALGLTTTEAENAFALSLIRTSGKNWTSDVVLEEKCSTLRKNGLLTFYPPGHNGMKQVGGMDNLKEWIGKRRKAFSDQAREFGLETPKGILMVGPPGSGKSLGARAISEELGLPLLRCDMGRIFAGIVGASEENARRVIQTAEAVSPCVLWLDEIEKGFAGSGGGSLDSGVGARVLGTFLTWMQEKKSAVFVYATANNVSMLPPELLRKGRFDETFSVLLPNEVEREDIFRIHLEKRGREKVFKKFKEAEIAEIVNTSNGFSGAEIEAAINDAMFSAFDNGDEIDSTHINNALKSTNPLSKMMAAQIQAMEKWCEGRTRPANRPMETKKSNRTLTV